jgi:hypothetical protein
MVANQPISACGETGPAEDVAWTVSSTFLRSW